VKEVAYENIEEKFETAYLGLAYMAKALSNVFPSAKINLAVIDNQLAKVAVDDVIDPVKAAIHGPVRVMPLELPGLSAKLIDIPYPFESTSEQSTYLSLTFDELHYETDDPFVSYRYGQRWTPYFEQASANDKLHSGVEIKTGGTYVIVGGLGAMGRTIAQDLIAEHKAKVVLLHRSAIPERSEWETYLSDESSHAVTKEKIRSLRQMEAAGGPPDLYQLDVTSETQVRTFSQYMKEHFPKIDGLIWAAGLVDYGGIIQQRDREAFLSYTASKINGVLLFEKYFDLGNFDFVALFSSIGNDFYHEKFGQVAYNAANAFMESYPHYARQNRDTHFFYINWCDWLNIGMTVNSIRQQQQEQEDIRSINSKIAYGISPREGVRAFYKCLHSKAAGATIFKGDLNAAIRSHKIAFAKSMTLFAEQPVTSLEEVDEQSLESRLISLFSDFFGAENLNGNSNFFELGGDSLKGMTLLARINQQFGSKLTLTDIYEYPTIGQVADNLLNRSLIGKVKKGAVSENVLHKITI
ncbi:MAG: beta-ketoacyl reductase, partial [Bacteroidota bacterium]